MNSLYDYLWRLDVGNLTAIEAGQCLLYLHYLSKSKPELATENTLLKEKLKARLLELRNT